MKIGLAAALIAPVLAIAPANAAQLVTNGGFETGNFSGWTVTGPNTNVTKPAAYDGTYGARFAGDTPDTLSQALNTVVGQTYTISFYLQNRGDAPNSFVATFDGQVLNTFSDSSAFTYFQFSFTKTSLNTPSLLAFTLSQTPAAWNLDDVSVMGPAGAAVPEPATWAMAITGFGLVGGAMRTRRRSVSFA